jgi:hypothetical protein
MGTQRIIIKATGQIRKTSNDQAKGTPTEEPLKKHRIHSWMLDESRGVVSSAADTGVARLERSLREVFSGTSSIVCELDDGTGDSSVDSAAPSDTESGPVLDT